VDEALYETNSKGNPMEVFDIYDESPLEVGNDRDINLGHIVFNGSFVFRDVCAHDFDCFFKLSNFGILTCSS
jgi:hypothetical protein